MKITKIYFLYNDEDFPKVPRDGSALISFFEDVYVYHKGYWRMVKYEPFGDHPQSIDLGKTIPYNDKGQAYSLIKEDWEYLK